MIKLGEIDMILKISNQLVDYLEKNNVLTEQKEIYVFGARLVISNIIGTIILLLTGLITGYFMEAIMYEVIMSSSRNILGGYHCHTYFKCIAVYISLYILVLIGINVYRFNLIGIIILSILFLIIVLICCPVENKKKQISQLKRERFKKYSCIYVVTYISIMFCLYILNSKYIQIMIYILIIINLLIIGGKIDYEKTKE